MKQYLFKYLMNGTVYAEIVEGVDLFTVTRDWCRNSNNHYTDLILVEQIR